MSLGLKDKNIPSQSEQWHQNQNCRKIKRKRNKERMSQIRSDQTLNMTYHIGVKDITVEIPNFCKKEKEKKYSLRPETQGTILGLKKKSSKRLTCL